MINKLCGKILIILLFVFLLMGLNKPALPEASVRTVEAIYTFDYRDVFFDIARIRKDRAVICGLRGRILVSHSRYNNLWSPRDSQTGEALTSLFFIDDKNGWAAGHGGIIIKTSDGGDTWVVQREPSVLQQPLLAIHFASANVGYACGAYDTFLKTADGGKTWKEIITGFDINLNALAFYNESSGFMVGEFGTILKTVNGGLSWTRLNTGGFKGTYNGINILPSGKVIAYGMRGKISISYDGGISWNDVKSGVTEPLLRATFSGKDVAIVGRTGIVLLSVNDAASFTMKVDEDLTTFSGVCASPDRVFLCVGEMGKIYKVEANNP